MTLYDLKVGDLFVFDYNTGEIFELRENADLNEANVDLNGTAKVFGVYQCMKDGWRHTYDRQIENANAYCNITKVHLTIGVRFY